MTPQELKILNALYNCSIITKTAVKKFENSEESLCSLIEKKSIVQEVIKIGARNVTTYVMTKMGEKNYSVMTNRFYFFRCPNKEKSIYLSYAYAKMNEEQKESWNNKDELMLKDPAMFVPDATYLDNGALRALIVIQKEEKEEKLKKLQEFKEKYEVSDVTIIYYEPK